MKRLYLLFLAVCAFACNSDDPQPSSLNSGNIIGKVVLFGKGGNCEKFTDHSGVKVTLTLRGKAITVETDPRGYFTFERIPTGTYEIKYEKENFGTFNAYSVRHLGGEPTTLGSVSIAEISTVEYKSVNLITSNELSIRLSETDLKENPCNVRFFQVYISDSPDVSYLTYKEMTTMSFFGNSSEAEYKFYIYTNFAELKGKKVYLKVYNSPLVDEAGIRNNYWDIYKNQMVYPSSNKGSAVLSTIF